MTRILLTFFLLLGFIGKVQAIEITFNQQAFVDDASIRLGDVAQFNETSPLSEALASQNIGQSPEPGENLILLSQNIRQNFLAANRSLASEISWNGSATVLINRRGVLFDGNRIQAIIEEFLLSNKKILPDAIITFHPNTLPLPFTLAKGELTYEVIPSNPGILSSSSFSIIFKVDDKVVKNMSVRGKIEAMGKVVVAAESLKKGLILGPQHLKIMACDISELSNPVLDPQSLLGMQLTQTLSAGSPVLQSQVDTLPIVHKGQKVRIVVQSGALHLTASGLAHTDGKLDQTIKIQNINSNKMVLGRVTGPGVVEVGI